LIKKNYRNGFCSTCFGKLASCDICSIKPNLCHYQFNTCRDKVWAEKNCFHDHYVYISKTSSLKIGITKYKQIPYRWVDQGAVQALPIIKVKSRYQAGLVECLMKNYIPDKTNWKKMLLSEVEGTSIIEKRKFLLDKTAKKIEVMNKGLKSKIKILSNLNPININYPIKKNPKIIKVFCLSDNNNEYSDVLIGIKGQYLIFEQSIINMKKLLGHEISIVIK